MKRRWREEEEKATTQSRGNVASSSISKSKTEEQLNQKLSEWTNGRDEQRVKSASKYWFLRVAVCQNRLFARDNTGEQKSGHTSTRFVHYVCAEGIEPIALLDALLKDAKATPRETIFRFEINLSHDYRLFRVQSKGNTSSPNQRNSRFFNRLFFKIKWKCMKKLNVEILSAL